MYEQGPTACFPLSTSFGPLIALKRYAGSILIHLMAPLRSGRDTEIDMIEREMEGGVVVIQPPDVHEHSTGRALGGLVSIEEDVQVQAMKPRRLEVPKA
jgi:hypothetical protein